jgi:hypothetical protein
MLNPLIILAIGLLLGGLIYAIIRSRLIQSKLLDAAAQREKHAPKATILPTNLTTSGVKVQESEFAQPTKPEESNQPNESEEPDQPTKPEEPDQPTKPEEPDQPNESEELSQPIESEEPNQPNESEESEEQIILESSSRQIDELSIKEREKYDVRDQARDENIMLLRLLVKDLFTEEGGPIVKSAIDSPQEQSSVELRNTWIEEYEEPLNEHAAFIVQEEVGSGIMMTEVTVPGNDDIQSRLEREGGKTGEVQISLAWDDFNDLDLHLFCPSGERIYFNNRNSACGGELDVDMNVRPTSESAVENIVWPENAPLGKYKVGVHFYKHHSKSDTTKVCGFRARITIHGKARDYSGSITHGQAMQMVTSFTLNR